MLIIPGHWLGKEGFELAGAFGSVLCVAARAVRSGGKAGSCWRRGYAGACLRRGRRAGQAAGRGLFRDTGRRVAAAPAKPRTPVPRAAALHRREGGKSTIRCEQGRAVLPAHLPRGWRGVEVWFCLLCCLFFFFKGLQAISHHIITKTYYNENNKDVVGLFSPLS